MFTVLLQSIRCAKAAEHGVGGAAFSVVTIADDAGSECRLFFDGGRAAAVAEAINAAIAPAPAAPEVIEIAEHGGVVAA